MRDQRFCLEHVLEVLRRDVLPAGGNDHVLLAIGDGQEAVLVERADVSGVEPAVSRERGSRRRLVIQVAREHGRPAEQDLAVLGQLQLDAGDRRPHGPELVVRGPVDGRGARLLGLAVALEDQDAEHVEELGYLLRERSAARDRSAQPPAEPFLHLRVDEPVGDSVFQGKAARDRFAALPTVAHLLADFEGPVDQAPPDARGGGEVGGHRRMNLLEHTRHRREDRRPNLRHDVPDPPRVGQERDRESKVRAEQVHQSPEVVGERQVEQHDVRRDEEGLDLVDRPDHVVVVAVQDHAALRRAGRPRRVDQREEVVVADLLASPLDRVGVLPACSRPSARSSSRRSRS